MEKKFIVEADGVHNDWYVKAREQKLDTLHDFLSHMLNDFSHDQQTIVHAITAGCMGTIAAMDAHSEGGLGASQTSQLLGMFIRKWARIEGPAKIMSWAGLLNPANEDQMVGVPKEIATWLKQVSAKALEDGKFQGEAHKAHLGTLANGELPWGFRTQ